MTSTPTPPTDARSAAVLPVGFALLLLLATWRYHVPLMLWDHVDLVPLYDAWQRGTLAVWDVWRIHDGSHLHAAAYAVLLWTTHLSGGQPWLDCLVSWGLLATQAMLLLRMAGATLERYRGHLGWRCAFVFLAFYPGHLANLQWGWQVAVFISLLFGAVVPIHLLTRERLGPGVSIAALASALIGFSGFSTALAMFPVAVLLILLRHELPWARRIACAVPWVVAMAGLGAWLAAPGQGGAQPGPEPVALVEYTLNYLGGGVLRFAENLASAWTVVALLTAAIVVSTGWRTPALRPWLGLMLFGIGCAALTALGRAQAFGADHAFVTRYVSFSSLFWLGWLGVMASAGFRSTLPHRWVRWVVALTVLLAVANGIHLAKKAIVVHERAVDYARHVVERYPDPDPAVLQDAYGDRAGVAAERLKVLRGYGFAPFAASPGGAPASAR